MSSNIASMSFDESAGTVVIYTKAETKYGSQLEASSVDFQEHGVMALMTDAGTAFRVLIPWGNILSIGQVA